MSLQNMTLTFIRFVLENVQWQASFSDFVQMFQICAFFAIRMRHSNLVPYLICENNSDDEDVSQEAHRQNDGAEDQGRRGHILCRCVDSDMVKYHRLYNGQIF